MKISTKEHPFNLVKDNKPKIFSNLQNSKIIFSQKSRKIVKQDGNVTFWNKCSKLLLLHLFFVIYDRIMSSLSNYVLGYIQMPLKEFLDLPFKKDI